MELEPGTGDGVYLARLQEALAQAQAAGFQPQLVVYNAGTDPYEGDALGGLRLSAQGIAQRDQMVWRWAVEELRAPIVMVLSGGYARESARVIADSLAGVFERFGLSSGGKAAAAR